MLSNSILNRSVQLIPIGSFIARGANIAMDITVRDRSQTLETGPVADEMPRRPLWPALVIAFAIAATMLWTGVLLWLLSRIVFVMVL
jgi:hypothetical protein